MPSQDRAPAHLNTLQRNPQPLDPASIWILFVLELYQVSHQVCQDAPEQNHVQNFMWKVISKVKT